MFVTTIDTVGGRVYKPMPEEGEEKPEEPELTDEEQAEKLKQIEKREKERKLTEEMAQMEQIGLAEELLTRGKEVLCFGLMLTFSSVTHLFLCVLKSVLMIYIRLNLVLGLILLILEYWTATRLSGLFKMDPTEMRMNLFFQRIIQQGLEYGDPEFEELYRLYVKNHNAFVCVLVPLIIGRCIWRS